MEFLRFGSRIPGATWGCCACDIIQNFDVDPDEPASIELVCGDSGAPLNGQFFGKTHREVFNSRIITGTFSDEPMANHIFLAIMSDKQVRRESGKKWLAILKEHGFEFIRTTDNSVYSNYDDPHKEGEDSVQKNYLFGLFRNIGNGAVIDPFEPPQKWKEMEQEGVEEISDLLSEKDRQRLLDSRAHFHKTKWDELTPVRYYKRKELEDEGVPVILAGIRSENLQELAETRESREKYRVKASGEKSAAPCATSSTGDIEPVEF